MGALGTFGKSYKKIKSSGLNNTEILFEVFSVTASVTQSEMFRVTVLILRMRIMYYGRYVT